MEDADENFQNLVKCMVDNDCMAKVTRSNWDVYNTLLISFIQKYERNGYSLFTLKFR